MALPFLAPKACGAAYVGFVAVVAEQVNQGAVSPAITITGMILAALAPTLAVFVLRMKTAAELAAIHVAVNSLAAAKDAKVESQDKKIEALTQAIILLTGDKAKQGQQILEHEKTEIRSAAAKEASLKQPPGQEGTPPTIVAEKVVTEAIVTPDGVSPDHLVVKQILDILTKHKQPPLK